MACVFLPSCLFSMQFDVRRLKSSVRLSILREAIFLVERGYYYDYVGGVCNVCLSLPQCVSHIAETMMVLLSLVCSCVPTTVVSP
mmetsp:Transcript_16694/g.25912  ORF Transcript_16694/g.25912 Transcript_16694/m.25912 type:complete len:85 (-) Transcript_16694:9-263(-)